MSLVFNIFDFYTYTLSTTITPIYVVPLRLTINTFYRNPANTAWIRGIQFILDSYAGLFTIRSRVDQTNLLYVGSFLDPLFDDNAQYTDYTKSLDT